MRASAKSVDSRIVAVPMISVEATDVRDFEVAHLGRYVVIGLLVAACGLLWAWSRIDLRETAVALDALEYQYDQAIEDHHRLELELAALRDEVGLRRASAEQGEQVFVNLGGESR